MPLRAAGFILDLVNSTTALITASLLTTLTAFAAAPAIGVVTASGHFTVDRARVWGNATLFSGGRIETDAASSQATLANGVTIQLAAKSSASVMDNRVTLWTGTSQVAWTGTGQIAAPDSYEIAAGAFAIRGVGAAARVRVGWGPDGMLEVASLMGNARVATAKDGLVLASIPAGRKMNFAMQAAAGAVTRTGCLVSKDGRYLLQDQNTQEVIEVTGTNPNLAPNAGNRVIVSGTASNARPSINIATSVVNAATVTPQSQGGCLSVAAALDARTTPAGAPAPSAAKATPAQPAAAAKPPATPAPGGGGGGGGGGMSAGAKVAVVGVVVGGGAGAAVALAGKKSSTSQ